MGGRYGVRLGFERIGAALSCFLTLPVHRTVPTIFGRSVGILVQTLLPVLHSCCLGKYLNRTYVERVPGQDEKEYGMYLLYENSTIDSTVVALAYVLCEVLTIARLL